MLPVLMKSNTLRVTCTHFLRPTYCKTSEIPDKNKYKVIYRLPQITLCSVLNKFKRLQLVAATTSIPGSFIANYFNVCDPSLPTVVTTIALASTVAIFSIGQLCTELIGYVYFSEDKQEVKLAYLDYWGRRKEAIYGVEDFLPLTNSPRFPSDFLFRRLYLYNSRHPFKLSLKYGKIVDEDSFKTVFCHELE
ncbi:transmembrane protein 186 [Rhodnius prolixus]